MLRLSGTFQANRLPKNRLPQRALQLLLELEKQGPSPYDFRQHSRVALLEPADDIAKVPREVGRYGLLEILDSPWRSYDSVCVFSEAEKRYYELVVTLSPGVRLFLFVPDEDWVDSRLRLVLQVETDEQDPTTA